MKEPDPCWRPLLDICQIAAICIWNITFKWGPKLLNGRSPCYRQSVSENKIVHSSYQRVVTRTRPWLPSVVYSAFSIHHGCCCTEHEQMGTDMESIKNRKWMQNEILTTYTLLASQLDISLSSFCQHIFCSRNVCAADYYHNWYWSIEDG